MISPLLVCHYSEEVLAVHQGPETCVLVLLDVETRGLNRRAWVGWIVFHKLYCNSRKSLDGFSWKFFRLSKRVAPRVPEPLTSH